LLEIDKLAVAKETKVSDSAGAPAFTLLCHLDAHPNTVRLLGDRVNLQRAYPGKHAIDFRYGR
jgi:hypothetical protein